jgi:hypothetical protein
MSKERGCQEKKVFLGYFCDKIVIYLFWSRLGAQRSIVERIEFLCSFSLLAQRKRTKRKGAVNLAFGFPSTTVACGGADTQ